LKRVNHSPKKEVQMISDRLKHSTAPDVTNAYFDHHANALKHADWHVTQHYIQAFGKTRN